MAATRVLKVDIVGDARGFQRAVDNIDRSTRRMSGGFSKLTGAIGIGFAALGGTAIIGGIKSLIDEAREAQKAGRQTAAVIKSTGGVAKVSAKDVDQLATALSNKVGVDDEVIAAGQNMLLTFKGVRNEAGKNNDIFKQATTIAVDMAAKMNQGVVTQQNLEKANIQLGKALNDPIKGISALTRVGVTFNDSQKEQIRTLVESGDTMAAQKIILGELKTEFAGAAAAAADPWSRLGVVMGNVKEEIGTALLPAFETAAEWLMVTLPAAIDRTKAALRDAKKWWAENKVAVEALAGILGGLFVQSSDEAAASTKNLTENAVTLRKVLDIVVIGTGYLVLAFLRAEEEINSVISATASLITFAGHAVNAMDRLRGGTGRAGDGMVKFGQDLKDQARRELKGIREDAKNAQAAIDRMHGKDVKISGTTSLQFTKTFTQADWLTARQAAGRMAKGGRITSGTGPTADDVLLWGSKGEAMVPARSASKPEFQAWAAGEGIPGFALGGKIDQTGTAHTGVGKMMDRWGTLIQAAGVKQAMSLFGGVLGGGSGAGGWQWQMRVLRNQFPGLQLISGFRPGAITATGNRSYHGFGRAVDIPPRRDVFNWIRGTYGKNTKELIFSPAGSLQVHNGSDHMYSGITRANHWDHVHWAYGRGGRIPEDVFGVGARSGTTYGFHGGETVVPKGGGGGDVHVHLHGPVYGDRQALVREVRDGIKQARRLEGRDPATV